MADARWLLLIISLPGTASSRARVSTWRKLKRSGALPLKDSVYLLPATEDATEMANWIAGEVKAEGGDAQIAQTTAISGFDDATVAQRFNELRDTDYAEIEAALAPLVKLAAKRGDDAKARLKTELRRAAQRLEELARIDFFKAEKGAHVRALCEQGRILLEGAQSPGALGTPRTALDRTAYQGRLWVTRARPKIDRLASAWLIRHFIDPAARFGFFADGEKPAKDSITFDTFGGDFTHEGEDCTFEVLVRRFGLDAPGLRLLGQVIHNADLKDDKFERLEHVGLAMIVAGLGANIADDQALVMASFPVFAALRTALEGEAVVAAPSRKSTPRKRAARTSRRSSRKSS